MKSHSQSNALVLFLFLLVLQFFAGAQQVPTVITEATPAITGKWSYRSFISDPNLSTEPNRLLFGSGTMEFAAPVGTKLTGTLGGNGWQLNLSGAFVNGNPQSLRFQGRGMIGGEEWVYDYLGYVVPAWPNGVDQRPAIVGTIIRTVPHSDGNEGTSPAGVVAQWIAVRQDSTNAVAGAGLLTPILDPTQQRWEELLKLGSEKPKHVRSRKASERKAALPSLPQAGLESLFNEASLPPPQRRALAMATQEPFAQPDVIQSANGVLRATFEVVMGSGRIGNDPVSLRNYSATDEIKGLKFGAKLVGPTLRVRPGDTMRITLVNSLAVEPPDGNLNQLRTPAKIKSAL